MRVFALGFLALWLSPLGAAEPARAMKGVPLTRFYSFDDIGDVSRGAKLLFDPVGRLGIVQDGVYVVLNDDMWIDLGVQGRDGIRVQRVKCDVDGTSYYTSLGSWGILTATETGALRIEPLTPADCPEWAKTSNFTDILCQPEGVYFAGTHGVAYWDRRSKRTTFIEIPGLAYIFILKGQVHVSSHALGTLLLDGNQGTFRAADRSIFEDSVIDHVALLGGGRAIMSTSGRRLVVYNHDRLTPLAPPLGERLSGRITALETLSDGNVAAAINGLGIYIISPEGSIVTAFTNTDYRSVNSLATNGDGVLWASTEGGVAKILHGAPVTSFGQGLGLSIGWPQIVEWEGRTIMASNGRVYEPAPGPAGEPIHFQLMQGQPDAGTWGIAAWQEWLLLANTEAVFAARPGAPFQRITGGAGRLAMVGRDVCLAISEKEITALRYDGQTWSECAPRVPGFGFPSVVHSSDHAVWIEVGANRAGRIALVDGRIVTQVFEPFSASERHWINVSVVGDTVVLNGSERGRIYIDDRTGERLENSPLAEVLDRSPYRVVRVRQDDTGRLWASHAHGVFTLTPGPNGYVADTDTYRIITEHWPVVRPLGKDVWISTARSLYHADPARSNSLSAPARPRLVSVRDTKANRELIDATHPNPDGLHLTYRQNSLAFRFFAGNYGSRRAPAYEFRLNDDNWTSLDASALLRLSDLREGAYRLAIRLADMRGPIGDALTLSFWIAPPWYRTWYAFVAYVGLGVAFVIGLVRLFLHRARARNLALERIVAQRTEELKVTMTKLQRETRIAATLAERNRLAGEIHDSLEQGFSGLLLQLETTAGLVACPPPIERALSVARNMVTFSRNEVRHAVWDLHSPMLDEGDLHAALKHLIAQSMPDPARASIAIQGEPRPLGSTNEHHLLRSAQEAIANAVKHAQAERVDVHIAYGVNEVCLSISDNGRGFEAEKVMADPQNGHFGLRSLRGRSAKIGGVLEIASFPRMGTRITVRLPCPS